MARINVNPTRMELTKLKSRLKTTTNGHKLLKDKQDEMIRVYMSLIRKNQVLRKEVENELLEIVKRYNNAKLKMSSEGIMEALMVPSRKVDIEIQKKSIMNIEVPEILLSNSNEIDLTYGFAFTPSELDKSVLSLSSLITKILKLSEIEKTCDRLAIDIEKTRRRVNAIEFVMIPDLKETIHFITMKLEDNERSNTIRLMKSKEIILNKQTSYN